MLRLLARQQKKICEAQKIETHDGEGERKCCDYGKYGAYLRKSRHLVHEIREDMGRGHQQGIRESPLELERILRALQTWQIAAESVLGQHGESEDECSHRMSE